MNMPRLTASLCAMSPSLAVQFASVPHVTNGFFYAEAIADCHVELEVTVDCGNAEGIVTNRSYRLEITLDDACSYTIVEECGAKGWETSLVFCSADRRSIQQFYDRVSAMEGQTLKDLLSLPQIDAFPAIARMKIASAACAFGRNADIAIVELASGLINGPALSEALA